MWTEPHPPHKEIHELRDFWAKTAPELRELIRPIQDEAQHERALRVFEALLSEVEGQADPDPASVELFALLGEHLHAYEQRHTPLPASEPQEVLHFLMEQHGLKQDELPEVGSQGVVSEILSGKRQLNLRQAKALAARFHVDPGLFIG